MLGLVSILALSSLVWFVSWQPSIQTNIHLVHHPRQTNYHQQLRPRHLTSFAAQRPVVADAIVVGSGPPCKF